MGTGGGADGAGGGLAVVTGASSGLGRAYAESLASRGHRLLVAARREDRLMELADRMARRHGTQTDIVVCDLATEEGLADCREAITAAGAAPEVVVLNAGVGSSGPVWRLDREGEGHIVRLNCLAVVDLAVHVLPAMVARGHGTLVVVSSAAALQPVPFMATYAASKAFELSFTEAVGEELRGTGVRAIAVCPGPTRTEFSLSAGGEGAGTTWTVPLDDPSTVVRATWKALDRGRRLVTTGPVARTTAAAARFLPRALVLRGAAATHRSPRRLKEMFRRPS
jgi:short-subunit dehydrogenase